MSVAAEVEHFLSPEDLYLRDMVEDDGTVDLCNVETFGVDAEVTEVSPRWRLANPSSHGLGARRCLRTSGGLRREGSELSTRDPSRSRGGQPTADIDDPAVIQAVKRSPTLKSLDSSILDVGLCSSCGGLSLFTFEEQSPLFRDCRVRFEPRLSFLDLAWEKVHLPYSGPTRVKPGAFGGRPSVSFPHLEASHQVPVGSSKSRFRPGSPQVVRPKLSPMHFGSLSPSASIVSPSPDLLQTFRFPSYIDSLHPLHSSLLEHRKRGDSPRTFVEVAEPSAQLMTVGEKTWVMKLQAMQLQTQTPALQDYYYQEYFQRKQQRAVAEAEDTTNPNKPHAPKLPSFVQKKMYEAVVHIEGSLGQVAVSTCYSPRRAIDAVHVTIPEEDLKAVRHKRLRILDGIEKMFQILLEVEGMERKLGVVPEVDQPSLRQKIQRLVRHIYQSLRVSESRDSPDEGGWFLQTLSVRKGTKLVSRVLHFLQHQDTVCLTLTIAHHLPRLIKNDPDKVLLSLFNPLTIAILGFSFTEMIEVLTEVTGAHSEASSWLQELIRNQFCLSLLYTLLSHGEYLLRLETPLQPSIGDFEKWTDTIFRVAKELAEVPKSTVADPLCCPSNLLALFCRYVDKKTIQILKDKIDWCSVVTPSTSPTLTLSIG